MIIARIFARSSSSGSIFFALCGSIVSGMPAACACWGIKRSPATYCATFVSVSGHCGGVTGWDLMETSSGSCRGVFDSDGWDLMESFLGSCRVEVWTDVVGSPGCDFAESSEGGVCSRISSWSSSSSSSSPGMTLLRSINSSISFPLFALRSNAVGGEILISTLSEGGLGLNRRRGESFDAADDALDGAESDSMT